MKKLKLKYPKHQSSLEKGLGLNTINLFKTVLGVNKNIYAKKFLKIKKNSIAF